MNSPAEINQILDRPQKFFMTAVLILICSEPLLIWVEYTAKVLLKLPVFDHRKLINLLTLVIMFAGMLTGRIRIKKSHFLMATGCLAWFTFSMIVNNSFSTSAIGFFERFIVMFASLIFGYNYAKIDGRMEKKIYHIVLVLLALCILGMLINYLTGTVRFLNGKYRNAGIYYIRPVAFSLLLFSFVPFLIVHYWIKKERSLILVFGFFILMVSLIYLTQTRVTLVAIMVFWFFFIGKKGSFPIILLSIMGGILVASLGLFSRFTLLIEGLKFLGEYAGDGSLQTRYSLYITILSYVQKSLVFGYGPGAFVDTWFRDFGEVKMSPHSDYLVLLFEGGIVGLLFYLLFQLQILRELLQARKKEKHKNWKTYTELAFFCFVGFWIISSFNTPLYKTELVWIVNLFVGFVIGINRDQGNDTVSPPLLHQSEPALKTEGA